MDLPQSPRRFNAPARRPRSSRVYRALLRAGVGWPKGEAAACKAVYAGSNPVPTSQRNTRLAAHFSTRSSTTEATPGFATFDFMRGRRFAGDAFPSWGQ